MSGCANSIETIRQAWTRVLDGRLRVPSDIPSAEETRELLGLSARLQSDELRGAVLGQMRAIVENGTQT